MVYKPYTIDFGPLDVSMIFKYCELVRHTLESPKYARHYIYHYTSLVPSKRANSALLMCAYQVLCLDRKPDEAWGLFAELPRFLPFRDASNDGNKFELYIIDCLNALQRAKNLSWFDINKFDLDEYLKNNDISYGNLTWIIPDKVIAFPNPMDKISKMGLTPEQYAFIFDSLQVTGIVRLNESTYDIQRFRKLGLNYYELHVSDTGVPTDYRIKQFIEICRRESVVAVHCKTGLGSSGTIIGCYAIKNYGFTANEYIAWARLCKPGSILGQQQYFLCDFYDSIHKIHKPPAQISEFPIVNEKKSETRQSYSSMTSKKNTYKSVSLSLSNNLLRLNSPVRYKTRYNQLVKIDPAMLELYSKNKVK